MNNYGKQVYVVMEMDSPYPTANKELKGIFSTREEAIDAIVANNVISQETLFTEEELEQFEGDDYGTKQLLRALVRGLFDYSNVTCLPRVNYSIEQFGINEYC